MQTIKLELTGTMPMLMNSPRGLNKFDEQVKALSRITKKRAKTEDDLSEISRLEWMINMYFDDEVGPFIPTWNVRQSILEGARMRKLGKQVERGLMTIAEKAPLKYKGPRDLASMWQSKGEFLDIRPAKVGTATVMRSRPIFRDWKAEVTFAIDETQIDKQTAVEVATDAGNYCGVMDYTPRFGRYEVRRVD